MAAIWTYRELKNLPTIHQGHAEDCKVDTGTIRVWLSRVNKGEVSVEKLVDGRWETVDTYDGRE